MERCPAKSKDYFSMMYNRFIAFSSKSVNEWLLVVGPVFLMCCSDCKKLGCLGGEGKRKENPGS